MLARILIIISMGFIGCVTDPSPQSLDVGQGANSEDAAVPDAQPVDAGAPVGPAWCSSREECSVDELCLGYRSSGGAAHTGHCVSSTPCEPDGCGEDAICTAEGFCAPGYEACTRDYDCPNAYCDTRIGRCVVACHWFMPEVGCAANPLPCALGELVVHPNDCWGCRDARCDGQIEAPCRYNYADGGAQLDEANICRSGDGAEIRSECCTLAGYNLQAGALRRTCAPDQSEALELLFGLGHWPEDRTPRRRLRVVTLGTQPPLDELTVGVDTDRLGAVTRCDENGCEDADAGQLLIAPDSPYEQYARFWFTFPSGVSVESAFTILPLNTPAPTCDD